MRNRSGIAFYALITCLAGALLGCRRSAPPPSSTLPAEVTTFAAKKEAQARQLADRLRINVSADVWGYFAAAKKGDFAQVERFWQLLRKRAGQYSGSKPDPAVTSEVWQTVLETELACEQFGLGEPKYNRIFAEQIIQSIPPGSIYFGGTDAGRGLVTLFCKSQETGDPFFTITQNALAEGLYLHYLETIYRGKIYTPSSDDSQQAFQQYLSDAQARMKAGKLKPGEDVRIVNNRVQVSGQAAVMTLNGMLAKIIFEKNPERTFFIEESFPLEWMYPHLEPHELIMKIAREPLTIIPAEQVSTDQKYWSEQLKPMLGDWLKPDSSVKDVTDFAEKVFGRKDLSGFKGDAKYVGNTNACSMFSKLRSSMAGVYAWRAAHDPDPDEKKRMAAAADFAFRQSYALWPASPEAVFRYVNLLLEQGRTPEALEIVQTSSKIQPVDLQVKALLRQVEEKSRAEAKPQ